MPLNLLQPGRRSLPLPRCWSGLQTGLICWYPPVNPARIAAAHCEKPSTGLALCFRTTSGSFLANYRYLRDPGPAMLPQPLPAKPMPNSGYGSCANALSFARLKPKKRCGSACWRLCAYTCVIRWIQNCFRICWRATLHTICSLQNQAAQAFPA